MINSSLFILLLALLFNVPWSCSSLVPKRVTIVGAGVIGMTTGITLLENGYMVEIIANATTPDTTSDKAAAFWLPFLSDANDDFIKWSNDTYWKLGELVSEEDSGVRKVRLHYLFPPEKKVNPPWWSKLVSNFQYLKRDDKVGFDSSFVFDTYLMETEIALPWLTRKFKSLGGTITKRNVTDLNTLLRRDRITINCSGLSSLMLAIDPLMKPIRGQIVIVETPRNFDDGDIFLDEESNRGLAYIVPRHGGVLLGGTDQMNDWNLENDERDVLQILNRTAMLISQLENAVVKKKYVGLRPYREGGARLELEQRRGMYLIHNYGHGGSGWTVSWGCARYVLEILTKIQVQQIDEIEFVDSNQIIY